MGTRVTASSVVLVLLVVLMRAGPAIAAPPLVLTDDRSDAVLEIEGFTGDGQRAIFRTFETTPTSRILRSVPTGGGAVTTLTVPEHEDGLEVEDVIVGGDQVVFVADLRENGVRELFVTPATGGTPTVLNRPLASGGVHPDVAVVPGTDRVLYHADEDPTIPGHELHAVGIDGSDRRRLSPSDAPGGVEAIRRLTPDGRHVVFNVDRPEDGTYDVWVASVGGGDAHRLDTDVPRDGPASTLLGAVTDEVALFEVDGAEPGTYDLWSARLDGSDTTMLRAANDVAPVADWSAVVTPDGSDVLVFDADADGDAGVDPVVVPVDGSPPRVLDAPLANPEVGTPVTLSPDGSWAVFLTGDPSSLLTRAWSVALDGDGAHRLVPEADESLFEHRFEFVLDGQHVLVTTKPTSEGGHDAFWVAPVDGGQARRVLDSRDGGGLDTLFHEVAPDRHHVVLLASLPGWDGGGLVRVALDSGDLSVLMTPEEFSSTSDEDVRLEDYQLAPSDDMVLFTIDYQPPPFVNTGAPATDLASVPAHADDTSGGTSQPGVPRIAGADRHATAAEIAAAMPPADTVYLVTGRNFPDALAAGVAAGRQQVPVLLTERDQLPDATAAALQARQPDRVVVVGGLVAVSTTVAQQAGRAAGGADVTRVAGSTRYDTAARLAQQLPTSSTVVLATGEDFPDSQVGGPLAITRSAPLLLTASSSLPAATADALSTFQPDRLLVLGGQAAVTDAVVDAARQAAGGDVAVRRLAGVDRFDTAARVARAVSTSPDRVFVATAEDYPDALAAAPLAALGTDPILLTDRDELPVRTRDAIATLAPEDATILGGTAAISDATARAIGAALP